jgi:nitroreductase
MSDRYAQNDHPINDLFRRRWSPRAMDSRPIEDEKLLSLLEAARWAPSSLNEQPWQLVVTRQSGEEHQRLCDCLSSNNRRWACNAAILILTVARTTLSRDARPNRYAWHDVGLATENLLLQAVELGLHAHPMAGFDHAAAQRAFDIPEDCQPVTVIALGYPGNVDDLPKEMRPRELAPRTRRPLQDFVFEGAWGRRLRLESASAMEIATANPETATRDADDTHNGSTDTHERETTA